nr:DUF6712 family protein [uncultured Pedobacter sp.]
MKILFNIDSSGASELQQLTGNYYANNDFERIQTDITLETEEIIKIIGPAVYQLAENQYYGIEQTASGSSGSGSASAGVPSADYSDLVQHIQIAIAFKATFNFYQGNIISHEDNGRKVKIDNNNEKMPWEWMFDRDDQANLSKAYRMTDRLIAFLDASAIEEWKGSAFRKNARKLLVSTASSFNQYFPIDNSGRFFYQLQPFLGQVQQQIIKPALGADKFNELLNFYQDPEAEENEELKMLLSLVQEALVLKTMEKAVQRLSLKVLPDGVVQQFKSMIQSRNASQAVMDETLRRFVASLKISANESLDEVKKYVTPDESEDFNDLDLLPKNDCKTKIFRT